MNKSFELLTNVTAYETEAKVISNYAKHYGVSEAIIVRSLLNTAEDFTLDQAIKWYGSKKEEV